MCTIKVAAGGQQDARRICGELDALRPIIGPVPRKAGFNCTFKYLSRLNSLTAATDSKAVKTVSRKNVVHTVSQYQKAAE